MQATYELKPFPFQAVAFVFALLAAVIIGGLGGYWVKSVDHKGASAAAAVTTVRQPSLIGENAAQTAAQSSFLYEQGGRPAAVYTEAAGLTTGGASMVGENARQDSISTSVSVPNARLLADDSLIGSSQPSLVGENGKTSPPIEKIREGHRR